MLLPIKLGQHLLLHLGYLSTYRTIQCLQVVVEGEAEVEVGAEEVAEEEAVVVAGVKTTTTCIVLMSYY